MITRKFITSLALASVVSLATIPAMASGVNIQQFGWGNAAGGGQTGVGDQIGVYQNGAWNTGIATQHGNHNTAAIGQDGFQQLR